MRRISLTPRINWQEIARENGFNFHHVDGDLYWDESVCYGFSLQEIEQDLEAPAQEIADMCLDLVADAVKSEELLTQLAIPRPFWEMVQDSWQRNEPSLYGRFDFAYDGHGPAKLYEYNADTPTSLYEAAYFQWLWLEDAIKAKIIPENADQFNSVQEQLIETFGTFSVQGPMHFASVQESEEDRATVEYLRDCAEQAGISTIQMYMEEIGVDANGLLMDNHSNPIHWLFKLYPWEFMVKDSYAKHLPTCDTTFVEPAWKMLLSNKAILPLLWQRHTGHPNLLPAWFYDPTKAPLTKDYVVKPIFSREGANIFAFKDHSQVYSTDGVYGAEGYIGQELCPPPCIDGQGPVLGVWIVGGKACGMGIREDASFITGNLSRFVPHCIID